MLLTEPFFSFYVCCFSFTKHSLTVRRNKYCRTASLVRRIKFTSIYFVLFIVLYRIKYFIPTSRLLSSAERRKRSDE